MSYGDGTSNDTTQMQAAVSATLAGSTHRLAPATYRIDGRGVTIPTGVTLDLTGSRLVSIAGAVNPTYGPKVLQALPGTAFVRVVGGEIVGEPQTIGLRIDSATATAVEGTHFDSCRDGVWVGGNAPSRDIRLSWVDVTGSFRSGLSLTNAAAILIEHCSFHDAFETANPGAGIDVEPNPGEGVDDLTIMLSSFTNNHVGAFVQPGKGRPGVRLTIVGNTFVDNSTYGLIVNSFKDAEIARNYIRGPLGPAAGGIGGVSIGGATLATIAKDITFSRNTIEATRPLVLAGVSASKFLGNVIGPGTVIAAGLGIVGNIQIEAA